ncbi:MAG: Uma2 family endonuclease [Snowella sp.]|nr:Uma2 family endonuclease [Snowella sp.]
MLQTLPQITTFQEFVDWLPENSDLRYELHHGNIVEMAQPVGEHEEIKGFLNVELSFEIKRLGLSYSVPNQVIVRPDDKDSGYFPDILVMNRANLPNESRWQKESILSSGASIPLVIEVVSTNWRNDYYLKFADYEEMGILEYWIVDYAALGGRNFIGNPKQPTISVCTLVEEEYQINKFQNSDRLISQTFPELNLMANQVFQLGMI